jgi:hypothetical protein
MKKWTAILIATVTVVTSPAICDEALEVPPVGAVESIPAVEEQPPKQVGKLSPEESSKGSGIVAKYVLAASAVVIGIVALILVAQNDGHHHHKKH